MFKASFQAAAQGLGNLCCGPHGSDDDDGGDDDDGEEEEDDVDDVGDGYGDCKNYTNDDD